MLIYRDPQKCLFKTCNRRTKKLLCKSHINKKLDYIPYYRQVDPFNLELRIINIQILWKNRLFYNKNRKIVKNYKRVVNNKDPISRDILLQNNRLYEDINFLYPIFINEFVYLYKLESLLQIINNDCKEIITNTIISKVDINNIKELCNKLNIRIYEEEFTKEEILHFKKTKTFQKLDVLGTYFPLNIFNSISKDDKIKVYQELRLMWTAFCTDNNINEVKIYGKKITWFCKGNITEILVEKINFLLNDNLDINLKKMISYLIVGAFAYVNLDIKKIYNNFDFI